MAFGTLSSTHFVSLFVAAREFWNGVFRSQLRTWVSKCWAENKAGQGKNRRTSTCGTPLTVLLLVPQRSLPSALAERAVWCAAVHAVTSSNTMDALVCRYVEQTVARAPQEDLLVCGQPGMEGNTAVFSKRVPDVLSFVGCYFVLEGPKCSNVGGVYNSTTLPKIGVARCGREQRGRMLRRRPASTVFARSSRTLSVFNMLSGGCQCLCVTSMNMCGCEVFFCSGRFQDSSEGDHYLFRIFCGNVVTIVLFYLRFVAFLVFREGNIGHVQMLAEAETSAPHQPTSGNTATLTEDAGRPPNNAGAHGLDPHQNVHAGAVDCFA